MAAMIDPRVMRIEVWQYNRRFWIVFTEVESDVIILNREVTQPEAQLLIQGGVTRVKTDQPLTN